LSAELAVELLPDPSIETRLVSAAFVEGIFVAVIAASGGASLDAVARDAEDALQAKATHIQLQGPEQLRRAVPKWFPPSQFAPVPRSPVGIAALAG